jgi:hypothetical protein
LDRQKKKLPVAAFVMKRGEKVITRVAQPINLAQIILQLEKIAGNVRSV